MTVAVVQLFTEVSAFCTSDGLQLAAIGVHEPPPPLPVPANVMMLCAGSEYVKQLLERGTLEIAARFCVAEVIVADSVVNVVLPATQNCWDRDEPLMLVAMSFRLVDPGV